MATAPAFENKTNENIANLVGKDLSYFTNLFGDDMAYPGNDSGVFVTAGASYSSYLCMYAGAFAIANYDYVMSQKQYTEYINLDVTTATVNEGKVQYSVTTKGLKDSKPYEIDIVVDQTGKIDSFTVTKVGATAPAFENKTNENIANLVGKDLSYFTNLFGDDMSYPGNDSGAFVTAGASYSSFLCMYAGAFATANYSDYLQANGGNE